jgi:DNA-binding response OmpR family regulator
MNRQRDPRVLILDDEQNTVETFGRMLRFEGFTVYPAVSLECGLEIAEDKHSDAIRMRRG